jgi:hypothetical protein
MTKWQAGERARDEQAKRVEHKYGVMTSKDREKADTLAEIWVKLPEQVRFDFCSRFDSELVGMLEDLGLATSTDLLLAGVE